MKEPRRKIVMLGNKVVMPATFDVVQKKLKPLKRQSWIPETRHGTHNEGVSAFNGKPLVTTGEGWIQDIEYPSCPDCGASMEFVFQIDSDDNVPYMFGDVGCSHVTRCAAHPERLTIAWACC